MKRHRRALSRFAPLLAAAAIVLLGAAPAPADVLNLPSGQTSLQFVTVGNPGNAADPLTGLGAVPYTYQIGDYDVTLTQYATFLNAVATTSDPYGLYSGVMATDFSSGISQNANGSGGYTYSVIGNGNVAVFDVSWGDAARFCNWLQNGQPTDPEGAGTTETGAYTLDGGTTDAALSGISRNPGSVFCLPSLSEWYKAAYYNGGNGTYWLYPTQSNSPPSNVLSAGGTNNANWGTSGLTTVGFFAGSPGPYGTFDQGGELYQWTDTILSTSTYSKFASPNSSWESTHGSELESNGNTLVAWSPNSAYSFRGFRVAEETVPEPSSVCLLTAGLFAVGAAAIARCRRCRRAIGVAARAK